MPLSAETQKMIEERYKILPKDVQDALLAVDLRKKLQAVMEKHHLHIDQGGALENETLFIMLGLEHPKDYIRNVSRELNIDADTAKKIAVDVNEQVFRPIRESLKQIHSISEADAELRSKNYESGEKKSLQANEASKLQAEQDHPILRLKKTSQEAASLISKKETVVEKPTERGNVIGWPKRPEAGSMKYEERIKSQELGEKKPLQANEATKLQPERKPFLKITPEKPKQETNTSWRPEQPEKEAPAPENLPTADTKENVPPLASYPKPELRIKNNELRINETDDKQQTTNDRRPTTDDRRPTTDDRRPTTDDRRPTTLNTKPRTPNATPVVPKDIVSEKLSSSFRLPRTETEHREERISETAKKQGYGSSDPYREQVE